MRHELESNKREKTSPVTSQNKETPINDTLKKDVPKFDFEKACARDARLVRNCEFQSNFMDIRDKVLLDAIYSSTSDELTLAAIDSIRDKEYNEASAILTNFPGFQSPYADTLLKHISEIDQRSKWTYDYLKKDVLNLPTRLCGQLPPSTQDIPTVKEAMNNLGDKDKRLLVFYLNDLQKNGTDRYQEKAARLLDIYKS